MTTAHRLATDTEIEHAAISFWGAVANKFPETETGDSYCTGQDEAALAVWANNDPGQRARGMSAWPLPSQISVERFNEAVNAGMEAAKALLPGVIDANRDAVFGELAACASDWIRWNVPDVADQPKATTGWFEVHVYESKDEWDACKGAGAIETNIETIEDAIGLAEGSDYDDAYEVTVKAMGEHEDYEPGEVAHYRFNRHRSAGLRP